MKEEMTVFALMWTKLSPSFLTGKRSRGTWKTKEGRKWRNGNKRETLRRMSLRGLINLMGESSPSPHLPFSFPLPTLQAVIPFSHFNCLPVPPFKDSIMLRLSHLADAFFFTQDRYKRFQYNEMLLYSTWN